MAAKSSIHIKRCNIGSSQAHNLRTKEYIANLEKKGSHIYLIEDLTHKNVHKRNPMYRDLSYDKIMDGLIALYKKTHKTKTGKGRAPQLKDRVRVNKKTGKEYTVPGWSPIREAVVLIKEDTKIEEFRDIISWFEAKGVSLIDIHLHFDEGYKDPQTGSLKSNNLHAHLILNWVNLKTGETVKMTPEDMIELQNVVAKSLGMERGESAKETNKKHIDHVLYREMKAQENLKSIEETIKEKEKEKEEIEKATIEAQKTLKETSDRVEVLQGEENAVKSLLEASKKELDALYDTEMEKFEKGIDKYLEKVDRQIEERASVTIKPPKVTIQTPPDPNTNEVLHLLLSFSSVLGDAFKIFSFFLKDLIKWGIGEEENKKLRGKVIDDLFKQKGKSTLPRGWKIAEGCRLENPCYLQYFKPFGEWSFNDLFVSSNQLGEFPLKGYFEEKWRTVEEIIELILGRNRIKSQTNKRNTAAKETTRSMAEDAKKEHASQVHTKKTTQKKKGFRL